MVMEKDETASGRNQILKGQMMSRWLQCRIILAAWPVVFSVVWISVLGVSSAESFYYEKGDGSQKFVETSAFCPARRKHSTCTLFMANSTIKNAGVGIFSTEHLSPGDIVGHGDVVNPLLDLYWHRPQEYESGESPFRDYVWQGIGLLELESVDESHGQSMMGYGMDAAINCHLALVNTYAATYHIDEYYTDRMHRSHDPGAGAFTPYSNGRSTVANDVPPGGELFKTYGDSWFIARAEEFGRVPLTYDYLSADILITKFGLLFPETSTQSTLNGLQPDLWDLVIDFPFPSRILDALPKKHEDAILAIKEGIWSPYLLEAMRPEEELREFGRCIDNISHGPSTIPQAGRGAFALQPYSAGTILTGSPLIHVQSIDFFEMYQDVYDYLKSEKVGSGDLRRDRSEVRTYQLALNYCWKHSNFTMLLCPYGGGINMINHNRTRANLKVQWAPDGVIGHDDTFLQKGISELMRTSKPRLAIDFVALRDIEEGEELFLDYGPVWEAAWQEHVVTFQAKNKNNMPQMYQSARQMNIEHMKNAFRTEEEQSHNPYPSNVQIRCHSLSTSKDLAIVPAHLRDCSWSVKDTGTRCHILERKNLGAEHDYKYFYRVGLDDYSGFNEKDENLHHGNNNTHTSVCTEWNDLPQSAIAFFDAPYTTDIHLKGAFRHPIGIPDELIPPAWKNQ